MSLMSTERELATHEAHIKHLQDDVSRMVQDMEEMKRTMLQINTTLAEARGGWKVLMLLGGAGGVLGAFVTNIIQKWFGG